MVEIRVPALSLIVLVGVSGSGKSTFAARHFKPSQIISSDFCRGLVADDENDQAATPDAFDVLHYIVGTRLRRGLLTVVDATSVQYEARQQLVALAKQHHVLAEAVVLDVDQAVAVERNASRPDRDFGPHVIPRQGRELRRGMRRINKEGFRRVHVLSGDDIDDASFVFEPAWTDKTHLTGPFDIIGDVHGCRSELETLLTTLGYELERDAVGRAVNAAHPSGRTVVFVGDLVDRGPDTPGVLRLAMGMVDSGRALCVAGNHEVKLVRALNGRKVRIAHGLAESLEQLQGESEEFNADVKSFMDGLISHYRLDGGRLVVAHAGLKESYHGRASGKVRSFALYGDTTGETDEYGLPVRYPWAKEYRGKATVVYGHTPVPSAEWVNNTICLDTGVVFGGQLTALRYPEREIVAVDAEKTWYEPVRPLVPQTPVRDAATLDYTDVGGTRVIETGLHGRVKIREENSAAALEVASRFAVDPRWLVYLPPTMSPSETSGVDGMLEHPAEAFGYFRAAGATKVVCQEKHMGSRAVAVVCRDAATAAARFGVDDGGCGAVFTRTGRGFFNDDALTTGLLDRIRAAADASELWSKLESDWFVLDAELMPWSAKARELIRDQYAAVGAAARVSLPAAAKALRAAADRGLDVADLLSRNDTRTSNATAFRDAYARYCWDVDGLTGVKLAPFQILAAEGHNLARRPHDWHLDAITALAAADSTGTLMATRHVYVDPADDASVAEAVDWWTAMTDAGGEGMVVKPVESVLRTDKGLVQPGVKVRGREYLRIIYGPDYTEPANLERLRGRFLGRKRSLALREYALGVEALDRLAAGEALWRVHEAVFGVLALESEPVDPRL
ncbi:polynucleotide kinase-phosphatase [Stackebrandtia nassauensis]|uniref:Metallophosphoesterase n=1 Tax=Stackebrandtia nassauensis (strain DSM 44728 / CIP 108903 / NRRL B-16338 / NBRC 102104 / LLR-40K-21) TaxID=446470 RepID=D3Q923_STANL|nr:polynucleotide kinase-phosphatase [Stackebrandtia nassauensis]ADD40632.1 metallophosphoesterase [Stackebrandtia nassauensis DSM 44728]